MMNSLRFAGQTDVGRRRKDNQDTYICKQLWSDTSALLAAIDGVGGYAGGEKAAAIAKEAIERYMASPKGDTLTMLREAVVFANNQIVEESKKDLRFSQMCCVLTTVVADAKAQKLYFAHVGDTRLYRFRDGVLEKLSKDHSLVGVREDANELTEEEAMKHPRRNEILREVGMEVHRIDDPDFLDYEALEFLPGDVLMLCSDGLSDMLTRAQMQAILIKNTSLETKTEELIELANQQGGHDNITVVLAQNGQKTAAAVKPVTARKAEAAPVTTVDPIKNTAPFKTEAQRPAPEPAKKKSSLPTLLAVFVGIIALAGAAWVFFLKPQESSKGVSVAPDLDEVMPQTNGINIDSLIANAQRTPSKRLVLSREVLGTTGDTLTVAQAIDLKDTLFIESSVPFTIIPADSTKNQLAFRVAKNSRVRLEGVTISGFETGVQAGENASLHLRKVYFNQVAVPVSAEVKQDTLKDEEVILVVRKSKVPPQLPKK
ncbi:protein phosphatase 2C domain-containing protein [Tellurirhabdus bombi]|uniref:protein phosphatase 2C domain-containing protein n=1 Tax=Tellurirhabdus bombi TaxID=2907205 RepID=UPI001F34F0E1|nr:protein phosphatase 2C domain-containing protein [Tellurirhabdus bombi]